MLVGLCCGATAVALEGASLWGVSDRSLLGWTGRDWRWLEVAFSFVIGVVSLTGFNYACRFIPALIYSSLQLVDPALCALLTWLSGIERAPSVLTCVGGAIVIVGVGLITVGGHKRKALH